MVAFYMKLTSIDFQGLSFKKALSRLCQCLSLNLCCFHEYLYKFCKEVLSGERNKRWNESLRRGKSFVAAGIRSFFLSGKVILFSRDIDRRIDTKALSSIKS